MSLRGPNTLGMEARELCLRASSGGTHFPEQHHAACRNAPASHSFIPGFIQSSPNQARRQGSQGGGTSWNEKTKGVCRAGPPTCRERALAFRLGRAVTWGTSGSRTCFTALPLPPCQVSQPEKVANTVVCCPFPTARIKLQHWKQWGR